MVFVLELLSVLELLIPSQGGFISTNDNEVLVGQRHRRCVEVRSFPNLV